MSHTATGLAQETVYHWRVRACASGTCGAWSEARSFVTQEARVQRYYYVADHLGSVRATVNEAGTVVHYEDYYPFGMPMPQRTWPSPLWVSTSA